MKELKKLFKMMLKDGWRLEKRKGHTVCFAPDGIGTTTLSSTPSNKSDALWDIKRNLKKIGYEQLFERI